MPTDTANDSLVSFGTTYGIEFAPDKKNFQEVGACYDYSASTDSSSVDRSYTTGESWSQTTGFKSSAEFKCSKVTSENLGFMTPQNVYAKGDTIEDGYTVGDGGAVQVGRPIDGKQTITGHMRLIPTDSTQKPIYMFNAKAQITSRNSDDGVMDVTIHVDFDKDVQGDIVTENS